MNATYDIEESERPEHELIADLPTGAPKQGQGSNPPKDE